MSSAGFMQDDYHEDDYVGIALDDIWTRRDGTEIRFRDMQRHHAWNTERMVRRNGHYVPMGLRARVGDVWLARSVFYHAWNVAYLLAHPWKINRCTVRGL